jgi:hypothetical protein
MFDFNQSYSSYDFKLFLKEFLPEDTTFELKTIDINSNRYKKITQAHIIGQCPSLDLAIFEMDHNEENDPRVAIVTDAFKILADHWIHRALIIFKNKSKNYRFSYLTIQLDLNDKNKVERKYSNAKRFSFFLGQNAKINTPTKYLIKKGRVSSFEDLESRFSVEVVNKEFYSEISKYFIQLIGGNFGSSKNVSNYEPLLKLPSISPHSVVSQQFAVRLIGRIVFCWFLKEKKDSDEISLMPEDLLSVSAVQKYKGYYHQILEPIFFETLNKPHNSRQEKYQNDAFAQIPYLNGGLFSPHENDFYELYQNEYSIYINTLVIPDQWFLEFFRVLELYHFTIDENISFDEDLSIDPEMLGRIFENLLAEINPETEKSARKSTGSYYTPRAIVNYMIDESLFYYLKEKTKISDEKLIAVISYDLHDDKLHPLSIEEKETLVLALDNVKILDPACGSGAFPIGILQKIVFILQQIDPEGKIWFQKQIQNTSPEIRKILEREFKDRNFDYIRKLGVIRENIYGVDIQPIATEISRLRCFLTLIVDEKIKNSEPNRGIEPLPNLDFKFVTANTLIGLKKNEASDQYVIMHEESSQLVDRLKELRDQYFSASESERGTLKNEFKKTQSEILDHMIKQGTTVFNQTASVLSTWNPFLLKSSTWFDPEWMFGIKDGFDVVIGNPPYIQLQKFKGKEIQELLKKEKFKTHRSTGDLYVLFYEKAFDILKKDTGVLCFITSNKWMRAGYGDLLRKYISEKDPLILIDCGPGIFESATVDTNILVVKNKLNLNKQLKGLTLMAEHKRNLTSAVDQNGIILSEIGEGPWFIGSNLEYNLKRKIEEIGKPLKNWDIKINYGIKTGFNEAFIINTETKERICKEDPRSEKIIKPILRGRDIKRYRYEWAGLWLLNVHNGSKDVAPVNISDYPAIMHHLDSIEQLRESGKLGNAAKNRKGLFQRDDQGVTPYNLRNCAYLDEFEKEKIVWTDIARTPQFTILPANFFFNNTVYMINSEHLYYLNGVLNSSLIKWYYPLISSGLGREGQRFFKIFVEVLPIFYKSTLNSEMYEIAEIVKKIYSLINNGGYACKKMRTEINNFQDEINNLVYRLYNLNQNQKHLINSEKS